MDRKEERETTATSVLPADSAPLFPRTTAGFSVVEMLAVLVVLGLGIGMAVLSLGGQGEMARLRRDSRALAGLLALARSTAISQGHTMVVWLDPVRNRARLVPHPPDRTPVTGKVAVPETLLVLDPAFSLSGIVARQMKSQNAQAGIRFYPQGSCDGGEIHLRGSRQQAILRLIPFTGHLDIHFRSLAPSP